MDRENQAKNGGAAFWFAIFWSLAAIEGLFVLYYYLAVPIDLKNQTLFGFSSERLAILILVGVFSFFSIAMAFFNRRSTRMLHWLNFPLRIVYAWLASLLLLATGLLLTLTPPVALSNTYGGYYTRLLPILVFVTTLAFQFLLFLLLAYPKKTWQAFFSRDNFPRWAKKYLIPGFLILWPFLFFLPRVVIFNDRLAGVGNDFVPFSYHYKVYLLDFLSHFRIPLWSPSEAAGFPFYSSPHTQTFYPLNIPLAVLYAYKGSYGLIDHNRYTVLGFSIFCLGLYYWLKCFRFNLRSILFSTLILGVSFKLGELIRFPTAVHTAAWFPWILFALTKLFLPVEAKRLFQKGLLLFITLVMFITAGYLYYVYYSLFLFIPYLLILIVPSIRLAFGGEKLHHLFRRLAVLAGAALGALVLCGPLLYKMVELLGEISERTGSDFEYSTVHTFNLLDSLGSLIFPPTSQTEGWYYFGLAGLLLLVFYLTGNLFHRSPRGNLSPPVAKAEAAWVDNNRIRLVLLGWFALISYITYGADSTLFILLWKYFPFFSVFRAWGRMNIILVPILALMVALAYQYFEEKVLTKTRNKDQPRRLILQSLGLLFIYSLILAGQGYLYSNQLYDRYWEVSFTDFHSQEVIFILTGLVSFLLIFTLLLYSYRKGISASFRNRIALVIILIMVSVIDLWHVGAYQWYISIIPETDPPGDLHIADRVNPSSFSFARTVGKDTISIKGAFSVGTFGNWYFNRYTNFYNSHSFEDTDRKILLGMIDRQRIYFSESIDYPTIHAYLQDASRFQRFEHVLEYTGDRLHLRIEVPQAGYLSFIDNWDPDWEARVNGTPVPISLLFGTFKSVRVPLGISDIEFDYRPRIRLAE